MKFSKVVLISAALFCITAHAIDDRNFAQPVADSGIYRQYAYRLLSTTGGPTKIHTGKDYDDTVALAIKAAGSGRIQSVMASTSGDAHGLGNNVIIVHPNVGAAFNPIYTLYGHLDSFAPGIAAGSYVSKGQVIGTMGMTGNANGLRHLHFEAKSYFYTGNNTNTQWGYIVDTATADATQLTDNGYMNPGTLIGNTAITYSDFRLTNGAPAFVYRNQPFTWSAVINNPFSSSSTYDARVILESTTGLLVGVMAQINGHVASVTGNETLIFSKPTVLSSAGSYRLRLQIRGSALGGENWLTMPTYAGGVNPSVFTIY